MINFIFNIFINTKKNFITLQKEKIFNEKLIKKLMNFINFFFLDNHKTNIFKFVLEKTI